MVDMVVSGAVVDDPSWDRADPTRRSLTEVATQMLTADLITLGEAVEYREAVPKDRAHPDAAYQTIGRDAARSGIPLAAVQEVGRLALHALWAAISPTTDVAAAPAPQPARLASALFALDARRSGMLKEGWVTASRELESQSRSRRSDLVEALLVGGALSSHSSWETAAQLKLPSNGRYAVVISAVTIDTDTAVESVEQRLAAARFRSAWRQSGAVLTGVAAIDDGGTQPASGLEPLLEVLRAVPTVMGVSPVYAGLRGTADAARLARVAFLAARPDRPDRRVLAFDRHLLAVSAFASIELNMRVARAVFAGLEALSPVRRELLLDTLEAWLDADGSTAAAAKALFVHRNTVRQRLCHLERVTGRSLSSPMQVAELCVALTMVRRNPIDMGS